MKGKGSIPTAMVVGGESGICKACKVKSDPVGHVHIRSRQHRYIFLTLYTLIALRLCTWGAYASSTPDGSGGGGSWMDEYLEQFQQDRDTLNQDFFTAFDEIFYENQPDETEEVTEPNAPEGGLGFGSDDSLEAMVREDVNKLFQKLAEEVRIGSAYIGNNR